MNFVESKIAPSIEFRNKEGGSQAEGKRTAGKKKRIPKVEVRSQTSQDQMRYGWKGKISNIHEGWEIGRRKNQDHGEERKRKNEEEMEEEMNA